MVIVNAQGRLSGGSVCFNSKEYLFLFMPVKNIVITLFCICLFCARTTAQLYSNDYELFTTRDGLPHNNVLSAIQDSYGFLWVGTYNGLSVYDGNGFRNLKAFEHQDDNWLYAIETIYEDWKGNIWIGTRGGLVSCFLRKEQKFFEYKAKPIQAKIKCFHMDREGSLWIGYESGLIGVAAGDSISTKKIVERVIYGIRGNGSDSLFILSEIGMYIYDAIAGTVYPLRKDRYQNIVDIDKSKSRTIVMSGDGFSILDSNGRINSVQTKIIQGNRSAVYSKVAMSAKGYYYYTDGLDIYKYDSLFRIVEKYAISDNVTYNENNILNVFIEDRSGILWLGTASGLYKIDQEKHQFQKYSINNKHGYITHNYVRSIYADTKNNVWVSFRSGQVNKLIYHKSEDRHKYLRSYSIIRPENHTSLNNYSMNAFCETGDGLMLAGGEQGILVVNDTSMTFFLPRKYQSSVVLVWSIYEDRQGNIWVGTNGYGLFVYDRKTQKIKNYRNDINDSTTISNNKIWKIFEDSGGRIWLGTDKGLIQAIGEQPVSELRFSRFALPGKADPNIWSINEDNYGNLWIGTTGNGVYKIALVSMQAERIDKIKAKVISTIVFDKSGDAWISTNGGLYKYCPEDNTVNYYSEDDGLLNNDFNYNAGAVTAQGNIFLGTKTGLVYFDPQKITHNSISKSQVALTSLVIEGNDSTQALYNSRDIILPYNKNNFSIDFALLDYSTTKPFMYRYRLKNYSNNWTYLSRNQNRAVFNHVAPGEYRFVVEGSADGINWHGQEKELKIVIRPAFWQMPAFWIVAVLSAILGMIIIVRIRFVRAIAAERAQRSIEKRIAELELQALQAQMNPHFIFNTMNSIQHFILNHNEIEANDYLSRFARLMRIVLESSKNKYIALNVELEQSELYLSLEQLRFEDSFDYVIEVDNDIHPEHVMIPSMLIQPMLENAIKHGLSKKPSGGLLRLIIDKKNNKEDYIRVIIDDNGIGREKANRARSNDGHVSRGIQIIEDRIKTYNFIEQRKIGILFVDKKYPEEGTRVEIEIPIEP